MVKYKMRIKMAMELTQSMEKMVLAQHSNLEELKKKPEKYRDMNLHQLMRKNSKITSPIQLKERNLIGSAKSNKCVKCKILLALHWVNLVSNL